VGGVSSANPPVDDAIGLSNRSRRARLLAALVLFGVLLLGTVWGDDVHFPFGPFRMYASTEPLDGETSWYVLIGVGEDGVRREVPTSEVGLRRAELEGRVADLVAEPALLGEMAAAFADRQPAEPLISLEVVRRTQPMRGGAPEGAVVDEVVVRWSAP
jgi:hypothetical protein